MQIVPEMRPFTPLPTFRDIQPSPEIKYIAITSLDQVEPGGIYEKEFVATQTLEERLFPGDAESLAHYRKMLAFNNNGEIQDRWGASQYTIIAAQHIASGAIAGAIIFQMMLCPERLLDSTGVGATTANQFTFSDEAWREHGIANTSLRLRKEHVDDFKKRYGCSDSLDFALHEIANPLLMTVGEHLLIKQNGEYSPFKRKSFWSKGGQRSFDIDYVITRTAEGIPARHHYTLHANCDEGLPSILIDHHVTTNTALCYLDGDDPRERTDFQRMQKQILSRDWHPTSDRREFYEKVREATNELLDKRVTDVELHLPLGAVLQDHYPVLFR